MDKRIEMKEAVKEKADYVRRVLLDGIEKSGDRGEVFVRISFRPDDAMAAAQVLAYALERMALCETEGEPVSNDTESRSPFHATVVGMLSTDYEERFKAEYQQTKIRYEKLKAFNTRIRAAEIDERVEMPYLDCPQPILKAQQAVMSKYLHILEVRAMIEGIDL